MCLHHMLRTEKW